MSRLIISSLAVGFLSGCSVLGLRPYDPFYKNTQALQKSKATFKGTRITGSTPYIDSMLARNDMRCRLTTFNMPAGQTVGSYVSEALKTELDAAGKVSPTGDEIHIVVHTLKSDTGSLNKGSWTIDFGYETSHGSERVSTSFEFESAFTADTACRNTAQALQDALRQNFFEYFTRLH